MPTGNTGNELGKTTALADECGVKETCIRCRFYEEGPHAPYDIGFCRRYPPNGHGVTYTEKWCGEFKPATAEQVEQRTKTLNDWLEKWRVRKLV